MEKSKSIIGLNLSVFLFMFGVGLIVPLLPQKIITLTGSLKTVGYLASAFAVSFVCLQFPIGRLSDRFGFRWFLIIGYLICSASGLLYCFSNRQEMIFLGRLLQGVGEAPLWALAPALLSTLYPDAKGKVIGFYNASLHLGLTFGSIFGILVSGYWVKNEPWLLFVILAILGSFCIFASVKEPTVRVYSSDQPTEHNGLKNLLKIPGVLTVLTGIILYGAGYGLSITVIPGYLIQNKGFTQTETGIYFTFFYIGISLSQIITGPVSDLYGRRKSMAWGLIMTAAGLGVFPWQKDWAVYPWLFLVSIGLGIFCVSALAWINNAVDDSLKGTVSGAFYLFWGVGYFAGPLVLGTMDNATKEFNGFYILALLCIILVLFQSVVHQRKRKVIRMIDS